MYNRIDAIEYALTYGETPNPHYHYFKIYGEIGGDCTNFVSQCLYFAGIKEDRASHYPWWYQNKDSWAIAWINSHSLYWRLKAGYYERLEGPRGLEVATVDEVELGDLIFYENESGKIDHVAIITGFQDGLPTITQHSPERVNISYIKTNKHGMRFLKIMN